MRLKLIWLVLAAFASALATADAIDDMARANMEAEHIPGMAIGIMEGETLKIVRTYGYANLETMTPVTDKTVFRIASMSKAFCAASALKLIEEGKLTLETRVVDVLPDAPEQWSAVRVKHLLSHTSGIPDSNLFDMGRAYSDSQFLALFWRLPLDAEPGTAYRYNNFAYSVLGMIVGKVSGSSLREFVAQRIFKPLGMTQSQYYTLSTLVPHRADGYSWQSGTHLNALPLRPEQYDGSGGIMTSVTDYAKWQAALHRTDVLSDAIKQQQWTRSKLNDGKEIPYGMGWFPEVRNGKRIVDHSGGTHGFTSFVIRNLDDKVTVFVFRNGAGGGVVRFGEALYDQYMKQREAGV